MQLVTFSYQNRSPVVGILDGDRVIMSAWAGNMASLIQSGIIPNVTSERFPLDQCKLLAPLRPGKILCVGRNYAEHAKELGNAVPEAPLLFLKAPSSVIGHGEAITWNASVCEQVDWEGELAVVIGKRAKNVKAEDALKYVYGYSIGVDISARDLQNKEPQWTRAKSMDTFCPLGPVITTHDEIPDPQALKLETVISGQKMQDGHTSDMIHSVAALIAYASQFFTLEAGDVLLTGTPAGVGKGQNPPRFLQDGDTVSVTIEKIGTLTNPCKVTG